MEHEGPRVGGRGRFEFPDHLAIFCVVLKCTKGFLGMLIDVKAGVANKSFTGKFGTLDPLRHVVAESTFSIYRRLRDKIASNSDQYAVRFDNSFRWVS